MRAMIIRFPAAHAMMGRGHCKGLEAFKLAYYGSAAGDRVVGGADCVPAILPANAAQTIAA